MSVDVRRRRRAVRYGQSAFLTAESLAHLVLRKLDTAASGWDFGAHGFGPQATAVATPMCDATRAWDCHAPDPQIVVHPGATPASHSISRTASVLTLRPLPGSYG